MVLPLLVMKKPLNSRTFIPSKLCFKTKILLERDNTNPVKIKITPSFSTVLISRGDAEIRSRVNEIFLVALFEIRTFSC